MKLDKNTECVCDKCNGSGKIALSVPDDYSFMEEDLPKPLTQDVINTFIALKDKFRKVGKTEAYFYFERVILKCNPLNRTQDFYYRKNKRCPKLDVFLFSLSPKEIKMLPEEYCLPGGDVYPRREVSLGNINKNIFFALSLFAAS